MRHTVQVIAKGFVGVVDPPPFSFTSVPGRDDEWEGIKRSNRAANVWRYSDGGNSDSDAPPLGLSYSHDYQAAFNSSANWTQTAGTTGYFESNDSSLSYFNGTAALPVTFRSNPAPGFQMGVNMPWVFRGRLFKVPANQASQRFTLRWHKYQLQIVRGTSDASGADNGIRIMRFSDAWTQTLENALNLLEDTATTAEQQNTIATQRALIYRDIQSVSGSISDGIPFEITFIPEAGGRLTIILAGEKDISRTTVKHSDIIATRTTGIMWPATGLTIRCNGGQFQWQVGQLKFAASGKLTFPPFNASQWDLDELQFNSIKDTTATGTAITFDNGTTGNRANITATLTTSDPRYTPLLYGVAALIDGGERNGSDTTVWDSDEHPLNGHTPIADCVLNVGTEAEASWADVTVLNPNGSIIVTDPPQTGGLGADEEFYDYEAFENRRVTITQDGVPLITNGVVIQASVTTVAEGTPTLMYDAIAKSETGAVFTCYDRWALLDEMPMDNFIYPGDGLWLSSYIRKVLRAAGESDADTTALTENIFGQGTPRRLPTAPPGETWQVMPSDGETFGDYIRRIVERWGMGYALWLNGNGTWGWGIRPNLSATVANFMGAATNDPEASYAVTTGGRWSVLNPLDLMRDYSEFGNVFAVEGAEGPNGVPLYSIYYVNQSINLISAGRSRAHIGRRKYWHAVKDTSLRTMSEVIYVRRSLFRRYGRTGRFAGYETWCHSGRLFPGDRVTVFGLHGVVVAMSGMSAATDKGSITIRELV